MILAAGLGKRMKSSLPKVLHEIGGKPLIFHILHQVQKSIPHASVAVIVGHGKEQVERRIRESGEFNQLDLHFVHQAEQRGTGHAARCAMDSKWGEAQVSAKSSVLILPGDTPLMTAEMVAQIAQPLQKNEALRLLTTEIANPTGYGRVVRRGKKGPVIRITEEKDANTREKEIKEIAVSIYLFQATFLKSFLQRLSNKNAQGEYYLTDLVAQAARNKKRCDVLMWAESNDLRGINNPWELSQAREILNERVIRKWALQGVTFISPQNTYVDVDVELSEDVKIQPGAILRGKTKIARGTQIGPNVVLSDMQVGEGAEIKAGTVGDHSSVAAGAAVGPYAHLRPDSHVGSEAKIGNFVELKKSRIGAKTSIAHLSYVGDAEVGAHVNIGCGFVTCNFDGRVINGERKHKTIIEDDVFLGSDCQAIAPIRIGKGAYVASGSTLTDDVEAGALAIARSRQVTKPGYAKKLKPEGSK